MKNVCVPQETGGHCTPINRSHCLTKRKTTTAKQPRHTVDMPFGSFAALRCLQQTGQHRAHGYRIVTGILEGACKSAPDP